MLWQNILSPTHGPRTHPRNQSFESLFIVVAASVVLCCDVQLCCDVLCCVVMYNCVVLWSVVCRPRYSCCLPSQCPDWFVGCVCVPGFVMPMFKWFVVRLHQDLSCQCPNDLLSTRPCTYAAVRFVIPVLNWLASGFGGFGGLQGRANLSQQPCVDPTVCPATQHITIREIFLVLYDTWVDERTGELWWGCKIKRN